MANEYLSDGSVKICVSTALNQMREGKTLVVEGQMLSTGLATPNKIIPIVNKPDIDTLFGAGSVLAESLKVAFCQAPSYVSIYALPRQDTSEGVKAVYNLSLSSPDGVAEEDGVVALYHCNKDYNVSVPVSKGDSLIDIAQVLTDQYKQNFMFDVGVQEDKEKKSVSLIYTAKNAGRVNNILNILDGGFFVAPRVKGLVANLEQIVEGSGDPKPNDYESVFGQCCHYAIALCSPDMDWQKNLTNFLNSRWDCNKPMCGGHGYVYERGTVGAILSTFLDSFTVSKMALHPKDPVAPYFKNVAYAARSIYQASINPVIAVEGLQRGLLSCILTPETCTGYWDFEEITHLQSQGFVIAEASEAGYSGYTSPHVFNDVTNYLRDETGKENLTYRSTATTRLVQQVIEELAVFLNGFIGMNLYKKGTTIPDGSDGINTNVLRARIKLWAERNVGFLFSGPILDSDIEVATDFEVAPKCLGKSGLLHINFLFRPPIAIDKIVTYIEPLILDNCDRNT